jgi:hypothetical protein
LLLPPECFDSDSEMSKKEFGSKSEEIQGGDEDENEYDPRSVLNMTQNTQRLLHQPSLEALKYQSERNLQAINRFRNSNMKGMKVVGSSSGVVKKV